MTTPSREQRRIKQLQQKSGAALRAIKTGGSPQTEAPHRGAETAPGVPRGLTGKRLRKRRRKKGRKRRRNLKRRRRRMRRRSGRLNESSVSWINLRRRRNAKRRSGRRS